MALTRLGFQTVLIGRNDVAQAVNQVCEHVRRNDTSPQQVLVTRCPHGCHVFASWRWHTAMGCSLEAIDMTMDCIPQEDSSQGHTVGRTMPKILLEKAKQQGGPISERLPLFGAGR
jgi:hypothetical protein